MAAARMATLVYPGAAQLGALQAALRLGHVRGIVRQLDAIVACDEACRPFVDVVRALTREFRFDAIQQLLSQAPHDPSPT